MVKGEYVMSEDFETGISRRRFLQQTVTAAAATTCLTGKMREVLAQAKATGKPILTAANINKIAPPTMPKGAALQKYLALVKTIKADPVAYFTENYTLTPQQLQKLKSIQPSQVSALLDQSVSNHYQPQVIIQTAQSNTKPKARMDKGSEFTFTSTFKEEPHGGWSGTASVTVKC